MISVIFFFNYSILFIVIIVFGYLTIGFLTLVPLFVSPPFSFLLHLLSKGQFHTRFNNNVFFKFSFYSYSIVLLYLYNIGGEEYKSNLFFILSSKYLCVHLKYLAYFKKMVLRGHESFFFNFIK